MVRAVPALILGLRDGLYQANRAPGLFGRLRMRAGLGQGAISRADRGYLGDCVVLVNRLIDSAPVRDALMADTDSDLALAVSEGIYRDVILPQALGLSAGEFRRIDVVLQDKDFASSAWLHVPRSAPARDLGPEQVIWGHSPGRTALREFVVPALGAAHLAATVVSHSGTLREWVLPGSHSGEPATRAATVADDADFEGPDDEQHEDGHHSDPHYSDAYGSDDGHHPDPYHPDPYHPSPYHPDPYHSDPHHPASGDQQADSFHSQDMGHHHFPDFHDGGH